MLYILQYVKLALYDLVSISVYRIQFRDPSTNLLQLFNAKDFCIAFSDFVFSFLFTEGCKSVSFICENKSEKM